MSTWFPLLRDETRCHDSGCPDADICERFLQRDHGTSHVASLAPFNAPATEPCQWKIESGEADW